MRMPPEPDANVTPSARGTAWPLECPAGTLLGSRMPGTGRPVVPPPPSLLPAPAMVPGAASRLPSRASRGLCHRLRRRRRLTSRWRCTFSPSLATTSPIMPIMWSRSR